MRSLLLVALGGALGACIRYGFTEAAAAWWGRDYPWGTLVVNVVGSLLLGWLLAESHRWDLSTDARLLWGTGLCGALTTFSTFTVDILRLIERGEHLSALGYASANLVVGLAAAALGLFLGRA